VPITILGTYEMMPKGTSFDQKRHGDAGVPPPVDPK